MPGVKSPFKRPEPEAQFLKHLVIRLKIERRPAMWVPLKDSFFVDKDAKRFSQKRPFDGLLLFQGTVWAIEAKYVEGESFNVEKWFQKQRHQAEGLWNAHKSGNSGILAIRFKSERHGREDKLVDISLIAAERGGVLYPTRKRIEVRGDA